MTGTNVLCLSSRRDPVCHGRAPSSDVRNRVRRESAAPWMQHPAPFLWMRRGCVYTFMIVRRRDLLHGFRGVVDSLPGASRPVPRTMPRRKRHHRARPDPRAPIFHPCAHVCICICVVSPRVAPCRVVSRRWVVRQMRVDTGPFSAWILRKKKKKKKEYK